MYVQPAGLVCTHQASTTGDKQNSEQVAAQKGNVLTR
jgi:hypothetical protein